MEVGKHDFIFDVVALLCDSACLIYNSFFFLKFSFSQSFSVWLMNTYFFLLFFFSLLIVSQVTIEIGEKTSTS